MQNQFMGKNLHDLQTYIDSMGVRLDSIQGVNAKTIFEASYIKTLKQPEGPQTHPQEITNSALIVFIKPKSQVIKPLFCLVQNQVLRPKKQIIFSKQQQLEMKRIKFDDI